MPEGCVSVKVAGKEISRGGELLADEAEPEEPGAHRVFGVLVLLGLGACGFDVLCKLAEREAKLNVALELPCVDAVLAAAVRGVELEKAELDCLSEYSDKRFYPNKFFIRSLPRV